MPTETRKKVHNETDVVPDCTDLPCTFAPRERKTPDIEDEENFVKSWERKNSAPFTTLSFRLRDTLACALQSCGRNDVFSLMNFYVSTDTSALINKPDSRRSF